jgi:hypothetical protein
LAYSVWNIYIRKEEVDANIMREFEPKDDMLEKCKKAKEIVPHELFSQNESTEQ